MAKTFAAARDVSRQASEITLITTMISLQLRDSCLPLHSKGFSTAIYKILSQILKASQISGFSTLFISTTMQPALWLGPNAV